MILNFPSNLEFAYALDSTNFKFFMQFGKCGEPVTKLLTLPRLIELWIILKERTNFENVVHGCQLLTISDIGLGPPTSTTLHLVAIMKFGILNRLLGIVFKKGEDGINSPCPLSQSPSNCNKTEHASIIQSDCPCRWILKSTVKSHGLNLERHWELPSWKAVGPEGISSEAVKCLEIRKNTNGENPVLLDVMLCYMVWLCSEISREWYISQRLR